jgi:hypothetical protein
METARITNEPPSAWDRLTIASSLREHEEQLCTFQAEYRQILRCTRKAESTIQVHRNVFSPLRSLPPEILAEIFQNYVQDSVDDDIQHSPFVISWVCRRWRDVALATSSIWTHLSLSPESEHSKLCNTYSHKLGNETNNNHRQSLSSEDVELLRSKF